MNAAHRASLAGPKPGDRTTGAARAWSGDDGVVGGVEVLPFAVLVFVVGTLLVLNGWAVIDAKGAAVAAAREAGRRHVESTGTVGEAHAGAQASALAAAEGHGWSRRVEVELVGGGDADSPLQRCDRVTYEVRVFVPTLVLPVLGRFGSGPIVATGRHSELVDPFRSGLAGSGICA